MALTSTSTYPFMTQISFHAPQTLQCQNQHKSTYYTKHTHTHTFNSPLSRTTWVSRYQKGKTNLDFTEAKDSEWQWHQLGHMQVCTSLQIDNHTSTPPLRFLQVYYTNNVKSKILGVFQINKTPWIWCWQIKLFSFYSMNRCTEKDNWKPCHCYQLSSEWATNKWIPYVKMLCVLKCVNNNCCFIPHQKYKASDQNGPRTRCHCTVNCVSWHPVKNWNILLQQFYSQHALSDSNQHTHIRGETPKFSVMVLPKPSLYH